jgi:hypothetical protein
LCKSRAAAQWLGGAHQWDPLLRSRTPSGAQPVDDSGAHRVWTPTCQQGRYVSFLETAYGSAARITWRMSEIQRLRCDLGEYRGGGACLLSRTPLRAHGWSLRTYVQLRCGPTEMGGPASQMSLDNGKETNKTCLSHCPAGQFRVHMSVPVHQRARQSKTVEQQADGTVARTGGHGVRGGGGGGVSDVARQRSNLATPPCGSALLGIGCTLRCSR